MLMDEIMDHGPILIQEPITITDSEWPLSGPKLDILLAAKGGELLTTTIPNWLAGEITPKEQEHEDATYTKKFEKADSELQLDPLHLPTGQEALRTLLKIKAFSGIGDCFFIDNGRRIKIKTAGLSTDSSLKLIRVTPEGKSEMDFSQYLMTR